MKHLKSWVKEAVVLQRNLPATVLAVLCVSVVSMNLLANKSIDTHLDWLALDCGLIFSWVVFLIMDVVTKHYGPRAANTLAVMSLLANLFIALMFFAAGWIPGVWGESFVDGSEAVINGALDNTIRGTWYVLLGSSVAFIVSAFLNNTLNWLIGKAFKGRSNFAVFALRGYVSTFIGQFADNMLFAVIVSHHFFGWSWLQCVTCALTGAVAELLFEIVFSPIGYRASCRWAKQHVGEEYFRYREAVASGKENPS